METNTNVSQTSTATVNVNGAMSNSSPTQVVPTRKKRTSKRRTVKPNGMQNIRLSVKVEVSDQMIEIADKRGMPTTLNLYRLYIEQGIERDLKRIANSDKIESIGSEEIDKLIGIEVGI